MDSMTTLREEIVLIAVAQTARNLLIKGASFRWDSAYINKRIVEVLVILAPLTKIFRISAENHRYVMLQFHHFYSSELIF